MQLHYSVSVILLLAPSSKIYFHICFSDGLGIVYSSNYGSANSWAVASGTSSYGRGLGMDSTGRYVVACSPSGLYRSTNYGRSWSLAVSVTSTSWAYCSSDSTGNYVSLSINNRGYGYVMMSTNAAVSWATTFPNVMNTYAVSSSADGSIVILTTNPGLLYISYNYGSSFTAMNSLSTSWSSVEVNPAGKHH